MQGSPDGRAPRPAVGYVLASAAATCWAVGGITAKWLFTPAAEAVGWRVPPVGAVVDPAVLSGSRAVAAFVVLAVYLASTRRDLLRVAPRDVPVLAAYGVFGLSAMHFAYYTTISLAGVATAILLEYLAPVFVLAFSVAFLRARPTAALPAGVGLSVAGCALVAGVLGDGGLRVSPAALAWGLASAVLFGAYALFGRYAAGHWHPLTSLVYGLGSAAGFWLVVLGPSRVVGAFGDARAAGGIVLVAVVGTVLPFGMFLAALRRLDATRVTVTSTLEPALAAAGAWVLFGDRLTGWQVVGGMLVLAAVAVVSRAGEPAVVPGA